MYVTPDRDGQKRLQRRFDDRRIIFGWNNKNKRNEVWYRPENSPAYMISVVVNVPHAIQVLTARSESDKKRAKHLLREIDEHNDKLIANMQTDAMAAVKSDLRNVAAGRKFYS